MKRRGPRASAKALPTKAALAARVEALELSLARERARRTTLESAVTAGVEQQKATADILRVISRSPSDVQPVADAIVQAAVRLLGAHAAVLWRFTGDVVDAMAFTTTGEAGDRALVEFAHEPISSRPLLVEAIRERRPLVLNDAAAHAVNPAVREVVRARGYNSFVSVPMVRGSEVIGIITVTFASRGAVTDDHVALLQTFAEQAVIAIENVRLFTELQEKNRALTETLEQQTATSEILRVISQSPTDSQPVFDTVVRNAVQLCGAAYGRVYRLDGEVIHLVANYNVTPQQLDTWQRTFPRPLSDGGILRQVLTTGMVLSVPDVFSQDGIGPSAHATFRDMGVQSALFVPMLRQGQVVGEITLMHREAAGFNGTHVALLKTFADQAVIAIENVRLFTELQEKNRAISEALEQQTATAEILGVISSSPTDIQPVFETIIRSAARLCDANFSNVQRFDGTHLHLAADHNFAADVVEDFRALFPMAPDRRYAASRAVLDRTVVHIADTLDDPDFPQALALASGWRSILSVPMLREGTPIGAITVSRAKPGRFTDSQVELLKTFADQAVIAIENVRLFTALQEKNAALTEALEQQTSTSEVLRAISSSPTDLEPVARIIAHSAARLCGALRAGVFRFDGELIHFVAGNVTDPEILESLRRIWPRPPQPFTLVGRTLLDADVLHLPDVTVDGRFTTPPTMRPALEIRTFLGVPMLRDGQPIGVIALYREHVEPFSDRHVELVKTFADQAVIAIENVRLFTALQERTRQLTRSVDELTALGEVTRAVSSTLDLETVLTTIVTRANELCGADGAGIYEFDDAAHEFRLRATRNFSDDLIEASRTAPLRHGEGIMGRLAETRQPIQIPDITVARAYQSRVRDILIRNGYRALLSVPLLRDDDVVGALTVGRRTAGEFPAEIVDLLRTFAAQSSLAIQNARLFHELELKSRELEVASQHKSEFLASMSHELRTPLNAIIGFSDVLLERMFGEVNDKQAEYLADILASGKHLLSLINDILDLSKIEAGRMELDVTEFDLPTAIDNALTLMRERAGRRSITLRHVVDERLGDIRADERKVKQVLLNLLSNAVKFTPEGGRIDVRAALVDGTAEISVTDTGVGIAPEDHAAVFEEFRQVGRADKKAEGTGLGLALCRKFVELHGGRIWVKSEIGAGSTFTFTLPMPEGVSDLGH